MSTSWWNSTYYNEPIGQFEDSTKVLPGEEIESSSDEDDQIIVSEKKCNFVSFSVVTHSFFIDYSHNVSHVISVTPIFVHREFREINVKISCNKEKNLAELSP